MKFLLLALALASSGAASAFAQTAVLAAADPTLAPAGGTVVLTATASYAPETAALGWTIALPANWSLVSVGGAQVPGIASEAGSTGTLEFAYTAVPSERAEFTVTVRYPAGTTSATATPTVLVRAGGRLATLTPAPVQLRTPDASAPRKSRN